ncbi:hypothetical protein Cylst_4947 [Cylindrospermum stagnale PCC 7417]|uniref:KAP family P-loop domain protein n=1 Tax=Cylindrospermum stagnale PCC 7417 TaxID=56107 RepID=K9X4H1_9NOST|nr:hypothetical protein [Cylindrospermum stagnale]AFZ26999.1 hypothetical protein Cylst_4947 [Cylindrospermum stagnale PCC 7417]
MSTNTSNVDDLIKNENPFAGHIVVRPQQIWGKSFPDVPSINSHASDAVFDAVEKIRKGQRTTVGMTITAEKGLGKSHLISRIRHRLQTENSSLFIYMSKYDNLNQIKYEFLQSVTSSLRAFGNKKVMQWQEIAAALINEAKEWNYTPQQYISQYPIWLNQYSNKFIEQLTKLLMLSKPEISNPYIVQAILWTLSPAHINYANRWLSGLELTQEEAEAMGLPNSKKEDRETESLRNVRQILDITSHYRIPVLCFDELDNADVAENGLTTAQVIGSLVKDLYNNLRGGVFLLAMYPETWNDQIRFLPQAEAVIDRLVSEQADRQPIELKYLNSDDIIALVQKRLQDFYEKHQKTPPHPLYPFDENELRERGKRKPTVRSILKWCADNFNGKTLPEKDIPPEKHIHPHLVKPYFQSELVHLRVSMNLLLDDEVLIAKALKFSFDRLIGETIEGVTIEKIEEVPNQQHIDFKIIGNQQKIKIGVDVVQQSVGVGVTAALSRLIDYQRYDLTRGCLVRSKIISPNATEARKNLRKLLQEKGGEWVSLQSQDIKPLLAIFYVWDNRESYELTEEQIFEFIKQKQIAINNPLIREILSDPSGQEPTNLTDDDLPMRIPQTAANADNIQMSEPITK